MGLGFVFFSTEGSGVASDVLPPGSLRRSCRSPLLLLLLLTFGPSSFSRAGGQRTLRSKDKFM